jgi:hypothetical protein
LAGSHLGLWLCAGGVSGHLATIPESGTSPGGYGDVVSQSSEAARTVRPPVPILVAVGLILVEAVTAVVLGVLEALNTRAHRAVVGVGGSILLLLLATWLVIIARGLLRLRMWARGMAIAIQVVLLPVAWSFRAAPLTWVAIVLAAGALTIIGCLVSPPATRALVPESMRRGAGRSS